MAHEFKKPYVFLGNAVMTFGSHKEENSVTG
jgi:hypothetical protein